MGMADQLAFMPKGKATIIGMVLAGIYYFVLFDDGSSYRTQEQSIRATIESNRLQLKKLDSEIAKAEEFQRIKTEMGDQMNRILKYIPEDLAGSALMKLLSTEAKAAGVSIVKVNDKSSAAQSSEFIQELAVDLELQGTFGQILLFMSQLTRLDKIITVKNIKLKKSTLAHRSENVLDFSATFIGYRFVGNKEKTGG